MSLDVRSVGTYGRRVAGSNPIGHGHASGSAAVSPSGHTGRTRRRRLPSQTEQQRRVAWGRRYGPLVGGMIRQSIARAES